MIETPEEFVEELFTNGFGEKAVTLVLNLGNGRSGGGWGKPFILNKIASRDAAIRAEYAELLKMCGEALGAFAKFREQYQGIEYFAPGIGCGIEDRSLNRYQAAEYGWDKAMEKVGDCLPDENVIDAALAALREAGVLDA